MSNTYDKLYDEIAHIIHPLLKDPMNMNEMYAVTDKIMRAVASSISPPQKRPKFHPGEHLLNELHRCQNGECSCAWLANEIENYIEEEIEKGLSVKNDGAEKIPATLEEALNMLEAKLTPDDRKVIAEQDPSVFHFSVGMGLRNEWQLWTGTSPLSMWFFKLGITHPDDMSGIILTALKHRVVGTPYDIDKDVKFYQDYWKKKDI